MAARKNNLARNRHKLLPRRRRRDRQNRGLSLAQLSRSQFMQLADAKAAIESGDFDRAEELLQKLDAHRSNIPEVFDALAYFCQETEDHHACCNAARRLMRLRPNDPDVCVLYAQESAFCGRIGIAMHFYKQFVQRWPSHVHVPKAEGLMGLLVEDVARKIIAVGLPQTNGAELLRLHEESLCL